MINNHDRRGISLILLSFYIAFWSSIVGPMWLFILFVIFSVLMFLAGFASIYPAPAKTQPKSGTNGASK